MIDGQEGALRWDESSYSGGEGVVGIIFSGVNGSVSICGDARGRNCFHGAEGESKDLISSVLAAIMQGRRAQFLDHAIDRAI